MVKTPCGEVDMSDVSPPKNCGLFKPGHTPHWIQMRRAAEDRNNPPVACRFIEARQDGTVVIEVAGQVLHLWNHEPERLADAVAESGGALEFQTRWGLLWVPGANGRYAFCVAKSLVDHVPCPFPPPVGSPAQLLKSAGGFSEPAGAVPHRTHPLIQRNGVEWSGR